MAKLKFGPNSQPASDIHRPLLQRDYCNLRFRVQTTRGTAHVETCTVSLVHTLYYSVDLARTSHALQKPLQMSMHLII